MLDGWGQMLQFVFCCFHDCGPDAAGRTSVQKEGYATVKGPWVPDMVKVLFSPACSVVFFVFLALRFRSVAPFSVRQPLHGVRGGRFAFVQWSPIARGALERFALLCRKHQTDL